MDMRVGNCLLECLDCHMAFHQKYHRPTVNSNLTKKKFGLTSPTQVLKKLTDFRCIVCHGKDVGIQNRLLKCLFCEMIFHQECHRPTVNENLSKNNRN